MERKDVFSKRKSFLNASVIEESFFFLVGKFCKKNFASYVCY